MSTKRVFYLDNIRFCASFLVILGHSHPEYAAGMSPEGLTQAGIWPSLFGLMSSPSSELFMTISGAILLPVRIPDKEFFKKIFQGSVSPSYLVTDLSRSRTRSERQNRRRIPACAAIYAGTGRILVHVRHLRPLPVRAHHLQMDP